MSSGASRDNDIRIMTLNVYFGTDLEPAFSAIGLPELVAAVAQLWREVEASDIPARATKIAQEIAAAKPDLVALQEVVKWSTGAPGAMNLKYDFLLLILEALREQGSLYVPIAMMGDLDQLAPLDTNGTFVRMEDRDAVLLRVDPLTRVRPYETSGGRYSTLLEIQNPVTGPLIGVRSWIAVDAIVGASKFRFIASHIESLDYAVQLAQTRELIAGPANTGLPVIFAGDLNSNGNQQRDVPDLTPSYPEMLAAGFHDTWAMLHPGDVGNTCCQAADLRNQVSALNRRLDLILTRGAITPISAEVVGANPDFRTASGVWPTDHAGVVATLRIE
jgi:endonuclease/exonuclease/phosphatase family metal-dependent hydrolase